jgi:sigma-B regulation protein RsbU (phosphoserine phosphatase)
MSLPLLCLLAPVTMTAAELRWELLNIGVGVLLLAIGLAAIGLFFARFRTRNFSLIYFGLFTILYAVRLLGDLDIIESVFDAPRSFWKDVSAVISWIIALPFGLFLYQLVRENLKRLFRWILIAQAIFAILEIVGAMFGVPMPKLNAASSIFTLTVVGVVMVLFSWTRWSLGPGSYLTRDVRVFVGGFLFWFAFIVRANLAGLGVVQGIGHQIEFIGFLVFVCCLGYITAHRTFDTEERLLEIDKELEIAQQIQSATLPRQIPKLPGLEIAARYVPMSAVAGDFYDFVLDDQKHLGILIADVSGHGVGAALIASMVKVAFAGQSQHVRDPARVLTELNLALCGKFEEHYVTAAYVFIDIQNGVLHYAGGGHPPIMLASHSDSSVRRIEENGPILGMIPEAPYSATEVAFRPGDRVLLYTDGAFEAMNAAQEEYGKGRLEQFLKTHGNLTAEEFSSTFLDELSQWSGHSAGGQDDDITFVVLDLRNSAKA